MALLLGVLLKKVNCRGSHSWDLAKQGGCFYVDLAVQIRDRGQQLFVLAGILTFTDKLSDRETANKIGGRLK